MIQTYSPEHYSIQTAAKQDYHAFYKEEISYRSLMRYPPEWQMLVVFASGERNGRYFNDMTEEAFGKFIKNIHGIETEEQWITSDVRAGRDSEKWLNVIIRKK